jgi:hypothetical protein
MMAGEFMKSVSLEVEVKFYALAVEFVPFIGRAIKFIISA